MEGLLNTIKDFPFESMHQIDIIHDSIIEIKEAFIATKLTKGKGWEGYKLEDHPCKYRLDFTREYGDVEIQIRVEYDDPWTIKLDGYEAICRSSKLESLLTKESIDNDAYTDPCTLRVYDIKTKEFLRNCLDPLAMGQMYPIMKEGKEPTFKFHIQKAIEDAERFINKVLL